MQAKQLGSRPAPACAGRYSRPVPLWTANGGENPPRARVLPSGYIDATVRSVAYVALSPYHSVIPTIRLLYTMSGSMQCFTVRK